MFHDQPLEPAVILHGKKKSESTIITEYKLDEVKEFLLQQGYLVVKVGLQFPDEMLSDATMVMYLLEKMLVSDTRYTVLQDESRSKHSSSDTSASNGEPCTCSSSSTALEKIAKVKSLPTVSLDNPHQPRGRTQFCCLCDNTFGSCCPDEITAKHYGVECIVHFGDACMSNGCSLPVFYVHPSFHFQAVPAPLQSIVEPLLIVDVLQRIKNLVGVAQKEFEVRWRGNQASSPCDIPGVELVVVGTHATREIIQDAQRYVKRIEEGGTNFKESGIHITWSWYSHVGKHNVKDAASSAPAVSTAAPSFASSSLQEGNKRNSFNSLSSWNTNGVCFRMLKCSTHHLGHHPDHTSCKLNESVVPTNLSYRIQLFLFVGPSNSSQPLHLSGVLQYNQAHYDNLQNKVIQAVSEAVPSLTILDEAFLSTVAPTIISSALDPAKCTHSMSNSPSAMVAALSCVHECVNNALGENNEKLKQTLESATALHRAQWNYARRVRQRDYNVEVVRGSTAVGILVLSLSIEGYYEVTMRLHKLLRLNKKRSYIIYVGHLNEFKLSNFIDSVDCFVAVACPNSRESHFPQKSDGYIKPVVSPVEVLIALASSEDEAHLYAAQAAFSTRLEYVLEPLQEAIDKKIHGNGAVQSGSCKKMNESSTLKETEEKESDGDRCSAGALINVSGKVSTYGAGEGALSRLFERHYVGLHPRVGETPVQKTIVEGKDGVARGYRTEQQ